MRIEQIHPKKEVFYDLITDPTIFVIRLTNRKEYKNLKENRELAPTTRTYDGIAIKRLAKVSIDQLLDALTNPEKAIVRIIID